MLFTLCMFDERKFAMLYVGRREKERTKAISAQISSQKSKLLIILYILYSI